MKLLSQALTLAAAAGLLVALSGCADGHYDRDGYWHGDHYYDHGSYDHDSYYRRDHDRRWVCDSDGDDCHWSD